MRSAVLHTPDPDTREAGRELIHQARAAGVESPVLGILFISRELKPEPIVAAINEEWPGIQLIGCSTDGESSRTIGAYADSSLLTLFWDTNAMVRTGVCRDLSSDIEQASATLKQVIGDDDPCPEFGIVLPDGLAVSGDAVLEHFAHAVGDEFPWFGGLAADAWQFVSTRQIYGTEVLRDSAPFAVFCGVKIGYGIDSGWQPMTGEVHVTKSHQNTVYEIDGERAIDWYRCYTDPHSESLGQHPLQVRPPGSNDIEDRVLRAPLLICEETGSITFAGDVPQGTIARLTSVRRDDVRSAVSAAVGRAVQSYGPDCPQAVLYFSCAARAHLLGTRTTWEIETISANLPEGVPVAGGYVYGEIAPPLNTKTRRNRLHNETIVIILLGEADSGSHSKG